ncbi:MAG: hypothetical protein PSN44_06055, partial [Gammaproteobacteria bacterium]|nr:hypothetical protein [Gammaproteobacteria bacterium]
SRAGLLTIAQLMESMQLAERVDQHFPAPKSNRGFNPSTYILECSYRESRVLSRSQLETCWDDEKICILNYCGYKGRVDHHSLRAFYL